MKLRNQEEEFLDSGFYELLNERSGLKTANSLYRIFRAKLKNTHLRSDLLYQVYEDMVESWRE